MSSASEFRKELDKRLKGRAAPDRRMLFVGILNKYLPENRKAVLVGGCAVEFYTSGGYTTGDVDLVGDKAALRALLSKAGFEEEGRYFSDPLLGIVTEMPGSSLRPTERPAEIEYEGYRVPIASLEDILIDRLLAAKYWRSPTDWEQAIMLAVAHEARIDWEETAKRAGPNDVEDFVQRLRESLASARDPKPRKDRNSKRA